MPKSDQEIIVDLAAETKPYDSIEEFLHDRRQGSDKNPDTTARLCGVLSRVSGCFDPKEEARPKDGFPIPWVTIVLGSETLDSLPPMPDERSFRQNLEKQLLADKGDAKQKAKRDFPVEEEVVDISEFAWRLLSTRDSFRSRPLEPTSLLSTVDAKYDRIQLRLITAAYAVTRAYLFSKLARGVPLNREEDETIHLASLGFSWTAESPEVALFNRAHDALADVQWVTKDPQARNNATSVSRPTRGDQAPLINKLVELIIDGLDQGDDESTVGAGGLLLLTEIAWHYLVDTLREPLAPYTYPDWAEQLIAIDIQSDDAGGTYFESRLSGVDPLGVAYKVASEAICNELKGATAKRSQELKRISKVVRAGQVDGLDHSSKDHYKAYWAYCRVLEQQAAVCEAARLAPTLVSSPEQTNASDVVDGAGDSEWLDAIDDSEAKDPGTDSEFESVFASALDDVDLLTVALPEEPEPSASDSSVAQRGDVATPSSMKDVPDPVAYVTTFDIEFELAWWHFIGKPFMVVLPINVVYDRGGLSRGSQAWIGYIVRPSAAGDAITAIRQPDPKSFFLVQSFVKQQEKIVGSRIVPPAVGPERYGAGLPIIVKLCGSPLVKLAVDENEDEDDGRLNTRLPLIQDILRSGKFGGLSSGAGENVSVRGWLRHALIIEDFQAMVAALPEADSGSILSLPTELRGATSSAYWRYWTLLGVDLGDSALRYRLVGQMLGSAFGLGAPVEQTRLGVSISRPRAMNRKARSLLRWKQVEMVNDEALGFSDELLHYVEHLADQRGCIRELQTDPVKTATTDPVSRMTWWRCELGKKKKG